MLWGRKAAARMAARGYGNTPPAGEKAAAAARARHEWRDAAAEKGARGETQTGASAEQGANGETQTRSTR